MEASRAGRNAEPTSWVCFTWIRRSMMSPRCISRRWMPSSIASISLRNSWSDGGAGGRWDMSVRCCCEAFNADQSSCHRCDGVLIRQSGLRKQREMQWEIGPFPPTARRANLVDPGCDLTKTVRGGSFYPFRGHLSRPACSHVKKLAKQAGDPMRSRPNALFRPVFLWPVVRWLWAFRKEVGDERAIFSGRRAAQRGARA